MPELHDDLDEWVTSDVSALSTDELPPLDDRAASTMLRRLRYIERRRAEIKNVARHEHERIERWEQDKIDTLEHDRQWIEHTLESFMRANYQRTRQKTLDLPHGKLQLRKPRTRVEIVDVSDVLDWALDRVAGRLDQSVESIVQLVDVLREELLSVKLEPAKSAIAKAVEAGGRRSIDEENHVELLSAVLSDGEVVPGVLLQRSTIDDFAVKLSDALVSVTDAVQNESTTQGEEEHDDD